MAGWLANGMPTIGAITNNGIAAVAPQGTYTNLVSTTPLIPVDVVTAAGQAPQTVAASPFDIAAVAISLIKNSGSSTVHTATQNVPAGCVETESLSTAAGADYTFQWVNSLITATSAIPKVAVHSGTNAVGAIAVKSITNATGTTTVVLTNTGTVALAGTLVLGFHV